MKLRRMTALVLVCVLLLPLVGCGKEENGENPPAESSNIKTNIFNGTELNLPKGIELLTWIQPYWDADAQTLTCVGSEQRVSEDVSDAFITAYSLVSLSPDGTSSVTGIGLAEGDFIEYGTVLAGESVFTVRSADGSRRVLCLSTDSGEGKYSDDVRTFFSSSSASVIDATRDTDGDFVLLSGDDTLLVIAPDWSIRCALSVPANGASVSLATSADGNVYVVCTQLGAQEMRFYQLRKDQSELSDAVSVPGAQIAFGSGFDYCYSTEEGIYGKNIPDDLPELLVDYQNSGIQMALSTLWCAADRDTMFFLRFDPMNFTQTPVLYQRGEDVELSSSTILRVGMANNISLPYMMKAAIADFNQTHYDCQIEIDEYDASDGGIDRLTLDIVTGIYQPDILIGYSSARYLTTSVEKGYYRDLRPYLENDDLINPGNLFDSVERAFDDGKGGIWGLTANITLDMLIAERENSGVLADRGYYTGTELLDYIDTLPDGAEFLAGMTQEKAVLLLFGKGGCYEFIDGDTCSFDSPEFVRYLQYVKSLLTEEEYQTVSLYAGLDPMEISKARQDGKIIAVDTYINSIESFVQHEIFFGTKDWIPIGYPVAEERAGAGIQVSSLYAFLITSFCEKPDLAWELLRSFFTDEDGQSGLPALKSQFRSQAEPFLAMEYVWYYDYGGISRKKRADAAFTEADLERPGIITDFTEEDYERYATMVDGAGQSILEQIRNKEIGDIIKEELSAFLGGVGSPEDCAKKIQSRVGIWLAEHK